MTTRSANTERSSWLSHDAYLDSYRRDADRLTELLVGVDPEAPVPTCPSWQALDLARHLVLVYSHKVAVLDVGEGVTDSDVDRGDGLDLAAAVRRQRELVDEVSRRLAALDPSAEVPTWMEGAGEGTAGAWARRMAHEALVHRVDAQVCAGVAVTPADEALAVDGVNELLTWMAGDPDVVASDAANAGAAGTVLVRWPSGGWLVELTDGGHVVRPSAADAPADAVISGSPSDLDLRLWGRPGEVEVSGSDDVLHRLRCRIAEATQ